jgi:hypothetical protein
MSPRLNLRRGGQRGNRKRVNLIRFVRSEIGEQYPGTNESKTPEMMEIITKRIVAKSRETA